MSDELPARREALHQKFVIYASTGPTNVYFTVGFSESGEVAEVFILQNKTGSSERAYCDAVARAVSLGLQHGVPLEEYCSSLRDTKFSPSGPVQGCDGVRFCHSPLDLLARWMEYEFLERRSI